jgi:hypothetical protein
MNLLDLINVILYDSSIQKQRLLPIQIQKRLPTMKLAIRIFALSVVVAGAAAAATTPKSAPALPSHQSATASFPPWGCGGHLCSVSPAGQ